MKTSSFKITLLAFVLAAAISTNLSQAQPVASPVPVSNAGQPTLQLGTYQVAERDANSQVWQRQTYDQTPDGSIVTNIHKHTELATGLNHLVNGQWVASKEEIDISPAGNSAAATNGQHQAYFPGDIYNGVIDLVTPDGKQLQSRPLSGTSGLCQRKRLLVRDKRFRGCACIAGHQSRDRPDTYKFK
jgi:hypothetical protein